MHPVTLPGPRGDLFAVIHSPNIAVPTRGWILHVPAFAEEMNKARPMVRDAATDLALQGYFVVILDLYGTGDSAGNFEDADWQCWKDDVECSVKWMLDQGAEQVILWGLRLGCLLAADVVSDGNVPVQELLFWQPVVDGKLFVGQFLRLRTAASMLRGEKETLSSLHELLNTDGYLDVAGYRLSVTLIRQLESVVLAGIHFDSLSQLHWLELVAEAGNPPTALVSSLIEKIESTDVTVRYDGGAGDRFWSTSEIAFAPNLLSSTKRALASTALGNHTTVSSLQLPGIVRKGSDSIADQYGVQFSCRGDNLMGVFHPSKTPSTKGVVLVVGGPQYRVGSHRQFVHIARRIAASGIPLLRFDYRGMGDSEGSFRGFESVDDDIFCAVDQLQVLAPDVKDIVLVGLCDAATAASFYAPTDSRVAGIVMLNPWVRSVEGEARTLLKHYYLRRLVNIQFWQKMLGGKPDVMASIKSFMSNVKKAAGVSPETSPEDINVQEMESPSVAFAPDNALSLRMKSSLANYSGKLLLILSGNDLTAAEFCDVVEASADSVGIFPPDRTERHYIEAADHTFSRYAWKDDVANWTVRWMKSW
jgi:exosortase A-associated hydrolase 1/exosortase A-associated hydrolase 2